MRDGCDTVSRLKLILFFEIIKPQHADPTKSDASVFGWRYNAGIAHPSVANVEFAAVQKLAVFAKEAAVDWGIRAIGQMDPPYPFKAELPVFVVFSACDDALDIPYPFPEHFPVFVVFRTRTIGPVVPQETLVKLASVLVLDDAPGPCSCPPFSSSVLRLISVRRSQL